jgi:hypothetical protein
LVDGVIQLFLLDSLRKKKGLAYALHEPKMVRKPLILVLPRNASLVMSDLDNVLAARPKHIVCSVTKLLQIVTSKHDHRMELVLIVRLPRIS